ncbi:hypothetical protein [Cedecea sp. NFIX57]|uniref:hypothetical protein n=1 Tax=Cedecea sp. NFIX57 TaxID=1566286 RepID=UPI000A0E63DD|nr:hypothetical protein [Cedecea sp. NFIX57]SMG62021.1 hypothetical protein SAMN03159353_11012 [Cedecea sp. NFIX57]
MKILAIIVFTVTLLVFAALMVAFSRRARELVISGLNEFVEHLMKFLTIIVIVAAVVLSVVVMLTPTGMAIR